MELKLFVEQQKISTFIVDDLLLFKSLDFRLSVGQNTFQAVNCEIAQGIVHSRLT